MASWSVSKQDSVLVAQTPKYNSLFTCMLGYAYSAHAVNFIISMCVLQTCCPFFFSSNHAYSVRLARPVVSQFHKKKQQQTIWEGNNEHPR